MTIMNAVGYIQDAHVARLGAMDCRMMDVLFIDGLKI